MNDEQTNVQNGHQITIQNRSEPSANRSEQSQNPSEPFGTNRQSVPNRSEQNQERSEYVPNEVFESHRTAPICSEEHAEHTITVREAARIFEEAGVPRTERAITNWCNKNARGITRLTACYNDVERKYYLTPESIEEAIREEKRKVQSNSQSESVLSAEAEGLSEHVRNEQYIGSEDVQNGSEENERRSEQVPNRSEQINQNVPHGSEREQNNVRDDRHENEDARETFKELQMENYNLKVQLEGHKHLIRKFDELTDKERERHEKEKLALVDRLTDARYKIGALEQQVLQLEAPKGKVHDAEIEAGEATSSQPIQKAAEREGNRQMIS
jgi:hypothetical protein